MSYDDAMGFSDGTAAFEERQAAARNREAAAASQRPLSEFEEVLAQTKKELRDKADEEAEDDARWEGHKVSELERMSALAAEFGRKAEAIGHLPQVVVTVWTEKVPGLFKGWKDVCHYEEVIGEGWEVVELKYRTEMGSVSDEFLVMKDGPWMDLSHHRMRRVSTKPRRLPRSVDPGRVLAIDSTRQDLAYLSTLPRDVEKILAKALIRAEQSVTEPR